MARSNSQPYWTDVDNSGNNNNQFDRLGPAGKYYDMRGIAAGTSASLTGSEYGYAAFLLGEGAGVAGTLVSSAGSGFKSGDIITTSNILHGTSLSENVIYDIAPEVVYATTGTVYVFKKQQ